MAEKFTEMRLKVDLQCPCCYKKVKNILCKFPQIRDQVYDEKQNLVTITVVCCSPEKIRDKLCCKGGKVIKSIEIVPERVVEHGRKPIVHAKPEVPEKSKPSPEKHPKKTPRAPEPCLHPPVPRGFCCVPCSEGYGGGPCYHGYGRPMPPPPCYVSYGYGCGCGYGKRHQYNCCDYFSEENTEGCTIM
ncbi:uncharacterized protein [Coffea arabica]|uniref:Uncharacterized protein n=1 Tax=Coffea arabica TaxID=13443 RepID=A0A6P6UCC1_COFAR|nr:heavy metal-associated isoprenylated plant protein 6-like isoform X2 [Coffea arabica]XP_027087983.1 heavy metal-associated isoprenylated plant protein 6-like isoform X1 [Coffea arabica]